MMMSLTLSHSINASRDFQMNNLRRGVITPIPQKSQYVSKKDTRNISSPSIKKCKDFFKRVVYQ